LYEKFTLRYRGVSTTLMALDVRWVAGGTQCHVHYNSWGPIYTEARRLPFN